jgi:hypothetical protein
MDDFWQLLSSDHPKRRKRNNYTTIEEEYFLSNELQA